MKGDQERCLSAGMDGYLSKPIRAPELDAVLASYVERSARGSEELAHEEREK
jgi:CheY-like chemotaxis protein